MKSYQIGMIGLAVMGKGLALNLAEKGFSLAGYNLEPEQTKKFMEEAASLQGDVEGFYSLRDLCAALERPRKIIMMIRAGHPVDQVLQQLLDILEPGDIVVDGGNSYFRDTIRRYKLCAKQNVAFVGMGVSGGESGARNGPAIMPGGDKEAYAVLEPFLTAIAAKVEGTPCCSHIGEDGAGHFVKMVHNGIEYGDMQIICEAYYVMHRLLGMQAKEIAQVFKKWNTGELNSYLVDITGDILEVTDPTTGKPLVEQIVGVAGSKGTGVWTVQESLELGVPIPTIAQAVFSRQLSTWQACRLQASQQFTYGAPPFTQDRETLLEDIRRALYASKICSYAQGFSLLSTAAEHYNWKLDLIAIARLFRGGCIIRAAFLERIAQAYRNQPQLSNLLLDQTFADVINRYQSSWRHVVSLASSHGVAVPALSASLGYFDSIRDAQGPLNLLQAQRDYFGAHTFHRVDQEGIFHFPWEDACQK